MLHRPRLSAVSYISRFLPFLLTNNPNHQHLQHAVKFHCNITIHKVSKNDRPEVAQAQVSACQEPADRRGPQAVQLLSRLLACWSSNGVNSEACKEIEQEFKMAACKSVSMRGEALEMIEATGSV